MRTRERRICANPNLLVTSRRDGYLVTPPRDWPYRSMAAVAAWARAGCPDYSRERPPVLTFDRFSQFREFMLEEGFSEHFVELIRAQGPVLGIEPGGGDATEQGALNTQPFFNSGSWAVPNNVATALFAGFGGGGGGGAGQGAAASPTGGGGGGGSWANCVPNVTPLVPNSEIAVSIGAGGAGGAGNTLLSGKSGGIGGSTVFTGQATFLGASGGTGGATGSAGQAGLPFPGPGGVPATSTTVILPAQGGPGGAASSFGTNGLQNISGYGANIAGSSGGSPTSTAGGGGGGGNGPRGTGGNGGGGKSANPPNNGVSAPQNGGGGGGGGGAVVAVSGVGGNGGNGGSGLAIPLW